MTTESIGWVGLGAMGGAIARNILKGGYRLTVYDKRDDLVAELVALGATGAGSAADVAEAADMMLVCLPSEGASLAVAAEAFGVANRPAVYVDHSTLTPETMNKLAAMAETAKVAFLDAPVSGNQTARQTGQLSMMVGGDEAAFERVKPVMETTASKIFHLGKTGSGSVAKIAHNLIALSSCLAIIEGLVLGVKHGIPIEKLKDAVMAGAAGSPVVAHIANQYATRVYRDPATPEAFMRLVIKDLLLAKELADEVGLSIDGAMGALDVWQRGVDAGMGDLEMFSMIDFLENPPKA